MKKWKEVLFFGALWGLAEATLGFVLHVSAASIAGFLMFPVGFAIMWQARERTDSVYAPMQVAAVAAGIKLVNLFFAPMWMTVFNPAAAILLEGLFVTVLLRKGNRLSPISCLLVTYGWRLGYLAILLIQLNFGFTLRLLQGGMASVLPFVTIDAGVNALMIFLIAKTSRRLGFEMKPGWVGATLAAAVIVTVVI